MQAQSQIGTIPSLVEAIELLTNLEMLLITSQIKTTSRMTTSITIIHLTHKCRCKMIIQIAHRKLNLVTLTISIKNILLMPNLALISRTNISHMWNLLTKTIFLTRIQAILILTSRKIRVTFLLLTSLIINKTTLKIKEMSQEIPIIMKDIHLVKTISPEIIHH